MQRIITGDQHLRTDVPRCRTETEEEWLSLQLNCLDFIINRALEHDCPVASTGDFFHKAIVKTNLINKVLYRMRFFLIWWEFIAGNHDINPHPISALNQLSIGTLIGSGLFKDMVSLQEYSCAHFSQEPKEVNEHLFLHTLVIPDIDDTTAKMMGALTPQQLLDKYPTAKWIFTGDYHRNFIYENDGRYVVNPGCMTRQAADFKDYRPGCYYVDTEKEIIEWIELPDNDDNIIDDIYLQQKNEKENRISAFVEMLESAENISFDFSANVIKRARLKDLPDDAVDAILHILQEAQNERV